MQPIGLAFFNQLLPFQIFLISLPYSAFKRIKVCKQ